MIDKMRLIVMMMLIIWLTKVVIIMTRIKCHSNLKETPEPLNFWRSVSKNSYPRKKCVFNFNFYVKSKIISNFAFQHIDQALKPRPCRLFYSHPFISGSALSTLNTSILNDITLAFYWKVLTLLVQIPRCQSGKVQFPPSPLALMMIKCLWVAQGEERGKS